MERQHPRYVIASASLLHSILIGRSYTLESLDSGCAGGEQFSKVSQRIYHAMRAVTESKI